MTDSMVQEWITVKDYLSGKRIKFKVSAFLWDFWEKWGDSGNLHEGRKKKRDHENEPRSNENKEGHRDGDEGRVTSTPLTLNL